MSVNDVKKALTNQFDYLIKCAEANKDNAENLCLITTALIELLAYATSGIPRLYRIINDDR